MEIKNDFVRTPKELTRALLKLEKFEGDILEPCCGDGAISRVLINAGHNVISTDKFSYGFGKRKDLFEISNRYDNIITNPPFNQKEARFSSVKKHLLSITKRKLALLWFVKNAGNEIESPTSKHLKAIYVFNKRVDFKEIKFGWLFAWYIWDKNYVGDVLVKRIEFTKDEKGETNG